MYLPRRLTDRSRASAGPVAVVVLSLAMSTICLAPPVLVTLLLPAVAAAQTVYDLTNDWSDTQNPNGVWSLNSAPGVLITTNPDWCCSPPPPAWAASPCSAPGHVPVWMKLSSAGASGGLTDGPLGRVVMHGVSPGAPGVTWTSPVGANVRIEGGVWRTNPEDGRSMTWTLRLNGAALSSGEVTPANPYSSSSPFLYRDGSGGPGAVNFAVVPGDVITLELTSSFAGFIGVDLRIVAPVAPVEGPFAMQFNGSNHVRIPHSPSIDFPNNSEATLELWVNIPNFGLNHILGKRPGCGGTDDAYQIVEVNGSLGWGFGSCTGGAPPGQENVWVHVAFVAYPDSFVIYKNGVRTLTGPCVDYAGNTVDLLFGRSGTCGAALVGLIDEVRFWKVSRTGEEISENYLCEVDPTTPGLVGYWNFDEDQFDQNVLDLSPFGNHGTLGNQGGFESQDAVRVVSTLSLCPVATGPCGQDTTPPAITLVGNATVTVECPASYEELGATVEDACDPGVAVTIGGDVVDVTTPDTYVVTYSATDASGNPAAAARTVEVIDTTPPTLTVDTTPIVVTDVDCSGSEAVALPLATAEDLCDATPTVTHNAPASFAPGTTQVTFTARDDSGNQTTGTLDVTVKYGAQVEVIAAQHTVGPGARPSTSKAPLAGILVRAYERGPGSCMDQEAPNGPAWQNYPAIVAACTPVNTGLTDAAGVATIDLPPGDYVIISHLATEDVYIGDWANDLVCGETMTKRLQLLIANGTPRPGKTTRLTGSELLIIEPEYVIWDDSTQVYPFVLESIGNWGVTASVAPPDGFVADYSSLAAEVQSEIEAVQFTITEEGSDLVPTRTTFQVTHANRRHMVRSEVGIGLTPEYARARGFDVAELRARGLIVDRDRRGGGGHGREAGAPEAANARLAGDDKPKPAASSTQAKESEPSLGVPDVSRELGLTAWPSPFSGNGVLHVAFGLPDGALPPDLELGLFDVLGRRVATIPTDLSVGRDGVAHLAWEGAEVRRGDVAPGVYFLRALAPSVGMRTECKLVVTR